MSLRDELLIPFRGIGDVGRRLVAGSVVLLHHGERLAKKGVRRIPRPTKTASFGDKFELLVAVAFGAIGAVVLLAAVGGFVVHLAAPYAAQIAITALTVWLVAALVVAPEQAASRVPASPATKNRGASAPPPNGEVLARFVRAVAARRGQHGVHLDELLPYLPGVDKAALVAALREAGIPVKEQLKLRLLDGRQVNRQGVRVEDLPPLPSVAEKVESEHPGSVVADGASKPLG